VCFRSHESEGKDSVIGGVACSWDLPLMATEPDQWTMVWFGKRDDVKEEA
jgi:hypothetical protein